MFRLTQLHFLAGDSMCNYRHRLEAAIGHRQHRLIRSYYTIVSNDLCRVMWSAIFCTGRGGRGSLHLRHQETWLDQTKCSRSCAETGAHSRWLSLKSVDKSASHLALIKATKSSSARQCECVYMYLCICEAVYLCGCASLYLCIYANDNDLCRRRCRRDKLLAWALWVIERFAYTQKDTHTQIQLTGLQLH